MVAIVPVCILIAVFQERVVSGLTSGVTAISAGSTQTCAVQNGAALCWGFNSNGELGQNNTTTNFGYQGNASVGDRVWNDLNGDGVIGVPGASSGNLVVAAGQTLELTSAFSGTITFAGATGTLKRANSDASDRPLRSRWRRV